MTGPAEAQCPAAEIERMRYELRRLDALRSAVLSYLESVEGLRGRGPAIQMREHNERLEAACEHAHGVLIEALADG